MDEHDGGTVVALRELQGVLPVSPRVSWSRRSLRLMGLLVVAWYVMTLSHELGHVVCGWLSGGKLVYLDLRPWALPQSMFDPDPNPLARLWGGPILGAVIPCSIALATRRVWVRFIGSFCVLANGTYLTIAWCVGDSFLDTTKLLEHGASPIALAVYCVVCCGYGYVAFRRACREVLFAAPLFAAPAKG